ncbi:DUF211 domain-containing protein [Archaeoglobus neptunius]|uniref:DUF211 domain-containing protein n=1 Tax=Archaeoglobus neptunius TaxID=2798580 RepID=UPI0019275D86
MKGLRRLVLDVLKPHEPRTTVFALRLSELNNVDGVNIHLSEIDQATENIKITILGNDLDFDEIKRLIEDLGGVIHSIDEVVAGKIVVESVRTEQD